MVLKNTNAYKPEDIMEKLYWKLMPSVCKYISFGSPLVYEYLQTRILQIFRF